MTKKDQGKTRRFEKNQIQDPIRRDIDLARLEALLAEQLLPSEPEEDDEDILQEAEEIDLDEAVEISKLPRKPPESQAEHLLATMAETGKNHSERAPVRSILKFGGLLILLAAVFAIGAMAGRGHIWKSGPGHNFIVWVEQTAGLVPRPEKESPPSETAETAGPAETADGAEASAPEPAVEAATADSSTETGLSTDETDEMPVWNWPDGSLDDLGQEETSGNDGASAGPEFPDSLLAENETSGDQALNMTAGVSPAKTPDFTPLEDDDLGEWPMAIEPDQNGLYIPPSDHDEPDENIGQALSTPSEASDIPLPVELSNLPGLGKFVVQVGLVSNEKEAQNKVSILTQQGFSAYYYGNSQNGYPVRVGHFATRQDADAAKIHLEDLGYEDSSVSSLTRANGG